MDQVPQAVTVGNKNTVSWNGIEIPHHTLIGSPTKSVVGNFDTEFRDGIETPHQWGTKIPTSFLTVSKVPTSWEKRYRLLSWRYRNSPLVKDTDFFPHGIETPQWGAVGVKILTFQTVLKLPTSGEKRYQLSIPILLTSARFPPILKKMADKNRINSAIGVLYPKARPHFLTSRFNLQQPS